MDFFLRNLSLSRQRPKSGRSTRLTLSQRSATSAFRKLHAGSLSPRRRGENFLRAAAVFLPLLLANCGSQDEAPSKKPASPSCQPSTALIGVEDGVMTHFCGCLNASQGLVWTPTLPANCTISNHSTVIFQFIGKLMPHQIFFADANLPSSPYLSPGSDQQKTYPVHVVKFDQLGQYNFRDGSMTGKITVQ